MKRIVILFIVAFMLVSCSGKLSNNKEFSVVKIHSKKNFKSIFTNKHVKKRSYYMANTEEPKKTKEKIIKVLIMPYVDEDGVFQTENYHFVGINKKVWIFDRQLYKIDNKKLNILNPLEG